MCGAGWHEKGSCVFDVSKQRITESDICSEKWVLEEGSVHSVEWPVALAVVSGLATRGRSGPRSGTTLPGVEGLPVWAAE